MREHLTMAATMDNLEQATGFLDAALEKLEVSPKTQLQLELALEEAYVNVVHYAYLDEDGEITLELETEPDQRLFVLRLRDRGIAFNPLKEEEPDVSLTAGERQIGGLGIFLVRKNVDEVSYEYRDGQNVLTMRKGY